MLKAVIVFTLSNIVTLFMFSAGLARRPGELRQVLQRPALIDRSSGRGNRSIGMPQREVHQFFSGGPGPDSDDPETEFVGDLQGLPAHRSGGAQQDQGLAHNRPMVRKYR